MGTSKLSGNLKQNTRGKLQGASHHWGRTVVFLKDLCYGIKIKLQHCGADFNPYLQKSL